MAEGALTGGDRGSRFQRAAALKARLDAWLPQLVRDTDYAVEEGRTFILLPIAAALGLIVYRILPAQPSLPVFAIGTALLLVLPFLIYLRMGALRLAVLGMAFWAGFALLAIHGALWGTTMLDAPRYGTFTAQIDDVIYDDGESQRWIVSQIVPENDWSDPGIRRGRVAVSGRYDVFPGDVFTGRVRFYPVPGPVVPGGFDSQFSGYFDGIGAYGSLLGEPEITVSEKGSFARFANSLRTTIGTRIWTLLGDRIGGIATALITGDQSRITEEDRAVMAIAGLAHILAISGLHVTLIAGTAFWTVRAAIAASYRLAQKVPAKPVAAAIGIVTALGYLVISGMGVSAIRATIMLCLVFAAVIAGRQALTMRNVTIAALVIMIIDPASIFRASFQMSFAAVVALIAAYEMARERREARYRPHSKIMRTILDIGMTSMIAGAATVLFTAYHFQQTAPFGILGNLMAMPIVTAIMMPMAFIAVVLMPLGLDVVPFTIMGWAIEAVLWCAEFVRVVSFGFDPAPIVRPGALVVGLLALGWLAFYQSRIRLWGPIAVVPAVFLFFTAPSPDVLVADGTQALAVRHQGQLALVSGRINTFATNVWSDRYMETVERNHEATGCDGLACILHSDEGFTLALVRDTAAFFEDCQIADVVIARIAAPDYCRETAHVIDAKDLETNGMHSLKWNGPERGFVSAIAIPDPARPWRIQR